MAYAIRLRCAAILRIRRTIFDGLLEVTHLDTFSHLFQAFGQVLDNRHLNAESNG